MASAVHRLELDLDVFAGPFDLLLSLILRDDVDLLEVELADIVVSYLDHLEASDRLDLESATEFLVLIAALLELKSRLMLPGEELPELDELAPAEAAEKAFDPAVLGQSLGGLLRTPPPIDLGHMAAPRVALADRLAVLRGLLRRGAFSFDEAVHGADRMTVAVTLFALLELYKRGEAGWEQDEPFGEITVRSEAPATLRLAS